MTYDSFDVRKKPVSPGASVKLVRQCRKVIGIMGKKVVSYDLKNDRPTEDDLKKIIIGRSGTLRAPCLQVEDVFIAGFNEDVYKEFLKIK